MGTPRGLRTPAKLSPQPSFPTPPSPFFFCSFVIFFQLSGLSDPRRRSACESTSPRSPWLRAWGRRYEGHNTWAWLRLNQGQGPTSLGTLRGSLRNGAGKSDCASFLEGDCTDALQRKRQESFSFRRRKRRGNSKNLKKFVNAGIHCRLVVTSQRSCNGPTAETIVSPYTFGEQLA